MATVRGMTPEKTIEEINKRFNSKYSEFKNQIVEAKENVIQSANESLVEMKDSLAEMNKEATQEFFNGLNTEWVNTKTQELQTKLQEKYTELESTFETTTENWINEAQDIFTSHEEAVKAIKGEASELFENHKQFLNDIKTEVSDYKNTIDAIKTEVQSEIDAYNQIVDGISWNGDQVTIGGEVSPHLTGPASEWENIPNKPSKFPPESHNHTWGDISNKPSEFTPSEHTHPISDIVSLQDELDKKVEPDVDGFIRVRDYPEGTLNVEHPDQTNILVPKNYVDGLNKFTYDMMQYWVRTKAFKKVPTLPSELEDNVIYFVTG